MALRLIKNLALVGTGFSLLLSGAAANAQQRLAMGATHSASSFFTYQVGVTNFLNNQFDDLDISVRELGGAEVSTQALLRREVDMGISVTSSDYAAIEGNQPFSQPADNLRTLYFFAPLPLNFVVASDSGIDGVDQLGGEQFNPGGRGTSTERQVEGVFSTLGIEPDLMRAEGSDALASFQNGQIVGFVKAGLHPDGYIQQAASSRDIDFLSMTEDQTSQVADAFPFFSSAMIAVGDAYGGSAGEHRTVQTAIGINTTSGLSEDVAYEIAKAVFSDAGRQAQADVYPPSESIDPVELTLNAAVAPLHAGVVRYMREEGHSVPDRLVPESAKQ